MTAGALVAGVPSRTSRLRRVGVGTVAAVLGARAVLGLRRSEPTWSRRAACRRSSGRPTSAISRPCAWHWPSAQRARYAADHAGPTLSARQINRCVLARQLLLERVDLDIPTTLQRVGGLQTQYAPSGYVGLWTRLVDFDRDSLTRALEDRVGGAGDVDANHDPHGRSRRLLADVLRRFGRAVATGGCASPSRGSCRRSRMTRWPTCCVPRWPTGPCRGSIWLRLDGARRFRQAVLGGRRAVARHGQGPAVGNVGAPPRRSLRSCRPMDPPCRGLRIRRSALVADQVSPSLRAGSIGRRGDLGGRASRPPGVGRSPDGSRHLHRRRRRAVGRSPRSRVAGTRHVRHRCDSCRPGTRCC